MNSSGVPDSVELAGALLGDGARDLGSRSSDRVDLLGDNLLDGGDGVLDEGRHCEVCEGISGKVLY